MVSWESKTSADVCRYLVIGIVRHPENLTVHKYDTKDHPLRSKADYHSHHGHWPTYAYIATKGCCRDKLLFGQLVWF